MKIMSWVKRKKPSQTLLSRRPYRDKKTAKLSRFDRLIAWVGNWRFQRSQKKARAKLLKEHGCYCNCPQCHLVLDGYSMAVDDGLFEYQCRHCGATSQFDFHSYPVPVLIRPRQHCYVGRLVGSVPNVQSLSRQEAQTLGFKKRYGRSS